MTIPTNVANARRIRLYCCAQCFGTLVEKFIDGAHRVVCAKDCLPGGWVTKAWAETQKAKDHAEAEEVKRNYPEFADEPLSANERQRMTSALYGEGD